MSEPPAELSYLDAIFAAIRAFTRELDLSQQWLARAEATSDKAWRLSFLREARRAYESAHGHVGDLRQRLGPPSPHAPRNAETSPLDQLQASLVGMQAKFDAHELRLLAREADLALALGPMGLA